MIRSMILSSIFPRGCRRYAIGNNERHREIRNMGNPYYLFGNMKPKEVREE